jgi:hypothetical protein
MTAIGSVDSDLFAAGRLVATEQSAVTPTVGTGVYRLAAFPAITDGYYAVDVYDVPTPSDASPAPSDTPLDGDGTAIVYWDGTDLFSDISDAYAVELTTDTDVIKTTEVLSVPSPAQLRVKQLTLSENDDQYVGRRVLIVAGETDNTSLNLIIAYQVSGESSPLITLDSAPSFTVLAADTVLILAGYPGPVVTVEHARVPGSRILKVGTRRDSAEANISGNIRMRAGEALFWAADFKRTQLRVGDLLNGFATPTVTGTNSANCSISTSGVFGTLAKFKVVISGAALTTDVIYVNISVTPENGETLTVKITVEIIA